MPVGWNDDFEAGPLRWTDKSFLDQFLTAAWERLRAAGVVETLPAYADRRLAEVYDPADPDTPADNVQAAGFLTGPHFVAAADISPEDYTGILRPTVVAVQAAVQACYPVYWNQNFAIEGQPPHTGVPFLSYYPVGPRSTDDQVEPGFWTDETLTAALGLSNGRLITSGGIGFRRKCPREVWALDLTGVTHDQVWTYRGGFDDWVPSNMNTVPVGGRARWYLHPGMAGTYPPHTELDHNPGIAQPGVWEHQGAGVWTRVDQDDPTAQPDTLDSENDPAGGTFIDPGTMRPGDYFGPWLFTNLRDALNLLVWTGPAEFIHYQISADPPLNSLYQNWQGYFVNTTTLGANQKTGDSTNFRPDEATAKGDAVAALAAATPFYQGEATLRIGSTVSTSWDAHLQTWQFKVGAGNSWQGKARRLEVYALALSDDTEPDTSGFGTKVGGGNLPLDVWTLYKAADLVAGADVYAQDLLDAVDYPTPAWPTDPIAPSFSKSRGAYLGRWQLFPIVRYDVAGGFEYTAST